MAKVVRFHEVGGPEVLKIEDMPLRRPSKGQATLRVRARAGMATATAFDRYSPEETTSGGRFLQERWAEFEARFSRYYGLLQFVAHRILGSSEGADDVIENCRASASQICPEFEQEGAFRSWLVRVLIDEALVVLRKNRGTNLDTVYLPKDMK